MLARADSEASEKQWMVIVPVRMTESELVLEQGVAEGSELSFALEVAGEWERQGWSVQYPHHCPLRRHLPL